MKRKHVQFYLNVLLNPKFANYPKKYRKQIFSVSNIYKNNRKGFYFSLFQNKAKIIKYK
jgi:hypothetical protein